MFLDKRCIKGIKIEFLNYNKEEKLNNICYFTIFPRACLNNKNTISILNRDAKVTKEKGDK